MKYEKKLIVVPKRAEKADQERLSRAIKKFGEEIKEEMSLLQMRSILLPGRRMVYIRRGETTREEYKRLALALPENKKFRRERILGEFDEGVADSGGDNGMLHHDPDHRKYILSVEDALFILEHRDLIEQKLRARASMLKRTIEEHC
jgi:hypothetical protein